MNFLLNILEKTKKDLFAPGKPLEKAYYAFDAADSFLFSPSHVTHGTVHVRDSIDTKRYMSMVIIALLPPLLFGIYNTGYQAMLATGGSVDLVSCFVEGLKWVLPLIFISYAVGGTWEAIFAVVRKHPINEGFLVTGLLFPLVLPPTLPLWQAAVGISFGVVIAKEVFGGTGMNILNPALMARAFCFFSYPASMSGDSVWVAITRDTKVLDGYSGATALGVALGVKSGASVGAEPVGLLASHGFTFDKLAMGFVPGSIGETSAIACVIGFIVLLISGVGNYRSTVGCVIGAVLMAVVFNMMASDSLHGLFRMPPHYHLVLGGFAFGAVYMATDPVSSAATNLGKWIYGILIGVICVLIRTVNPAYPESMMLAILFMNVFAPLIDYYVVKAKNQRRSLRHA